MHKLPQPVKVWWWGPAFRYEAPQAGRFRQFNQIDAEAIGSDSPLVDAEQVIMLDELLRGLGIEGIRLRLSSLGSAASRAEYREELKSYLRGSRERALPGGPRAHRREPDARLRRRRRGHAGGDG